MARYIVVFFCLAVSSVIAAPASNEQLDKATVNDVAVNSVSEEKKAEQSIQPVNTSASTVEILGITTAVDGPSPSSPAVENPPFKPQRAGSMFARLIDDIFQIPINVLQNVARLITSPFVQSKKVPEELATVS